MAAWAAIRRIARERRAELLGAAADALVPAADLVAVALDREGLWASGTTSDDPILAGAQALLDRGGRGILYDAGLPETAVRFNLAHELGHWFLHGDADTALPVACGPEDIASDPVADPLPYGEAYITGYSPAERREVEANVFAAELLLPAPALRAAFLARRTPEEIATDVGLSEGAALAQLAEALLLPADERRTPNTEHRTPNTEHRTPNTEHPTPNTQHRTPNTEHRTPNTSLDASQLAAARLDRGPALVAAGPGTGKTRTLIARIEYLLERGALPEQILALTFSNRAAEEMRERLAASQPEAARRVWIGTFHAFGLELLRRYGTRIGLPAVPTLVDPLDAAALLERKLAELDLVEYEYLHNPTFPFRDILAAISRAKDELVSPADYAACADQMAEGARVAGDERALREAAKAQEVARVYRVWQDSLKSEGRLDFGDLLYRAVELLRAEPEVAAEVRARYPHILVDEYQDVNRASAVLVREIAGEGAGLWAVGDLRQAIYRFRGASPANVARFDDDYPAGIRLRLDVNYRSMPPIVALFEAAGAMLEPCDTASLRASRGDSTSNEVRSDGARPGRAAAGAVSSVYESAGPHPSEPDGTSPVPTQTADACRGRAETDEASPGLTRIAAPAIVVATADDEEAQADGIASGLRAFQVAGVPLREQAILCRTNGQAASVAAALERREVPVVYLGSMLSRPEVRDMLALLSLAVDGHGQGLVRAATLPEYAASANELLAVLERAHDLDRPFPAALDDCGVPAFERLAAQLRPLSFRGDAFAFFSRYLFGPATYLRDLLGDPRVAAAQRRLGMYQLLQLARAFGRRAEAAADRPQQAFLEHVRRLLATGEDARARVPAGADQIDGVRVMTVHAAKGLEFPVVFVPNLAADLFPPRARGAMARLPAALAGDAAQEQAGEEERLFYVALSRARDHLVLSHPASINGKARAVSPLLARLQPALDAVGAERVRWTAESEPERHEATKEAPAPRTEDRTPNTEHRLAAVEQYTRCPRQYYYDRVLRLPRGGEEAPYRPYRECVREMGRWLGEVRATGEAPDMASAQRKLDEVWREHGPLGHAHEPVLRRSAAALVESMLQDSGAEPARPEELIAQLASGSIRVPVDHTCRGSAGGLVVEQHHIGREGESDHTDPRLALARLAARQRADRSDVEVRIRYLRTGRKRVVEESPRYEPNRIAKYEEALRAIAAGDFAARPSDEQCSRCPFFFVCPA